jgi:hypothetical protein
MPGSSSIAIIVCWSLHARDAGRIEEARTRRKAKLTQHEVEVKIKGGVTVPIVTGNTQSSTRVGKEHADGLKVLGLDRNVFMVPGPGKVACADSSRGFRELLVER